MARIILSQLSLHLEDGMLLETQCGSRSEKSFVDMVFALRQTQEICAEQNRPIHAVFINFTTVFDTVSRDGLWIVLAKAAFCEDDQTI